MDYVNNTLYNTKTYLKNTYDRHRNKEFGGRHEKRIQ